MISMTNKHFPITASQYGLPEIQSIGFIVNKLYYPPLLLSKLLVIPWTIWAWAVFSKKNNRQLAKKYTRYCLVEMIQRLFRASLGSLICFSIINS